MRDFEESVGHIIGQADHCEHHHHDAHYDPHVQETTKIAEIRDNFGQLRFKVFLIDMLDYYEEEICKDDNYRITVDSFCYGPGPVTILKEYRRHFGEAYAFYLKCIDEYKHLALAETRDFQDIEIYADKIGYHKVDPKCCRNCKWSKCIQHHKLVCMNNRLFYAARSKFIGDIQPEVAPDGICNYFDDRRPNHNWRQSK